MELVLGTVQFGLRYGIAGRDTAVPEGEVRGILACAAARGVRMLDTAAAYGDIEGRLVPLLPDGEWRIVTKLPALPAGLGRGDVAAWTDTALARVDARLGVRVHGVLLHRAEDLLEPHAEALWRCCAAWSAARGCKLGVSCYDTGTLEAVLARFPVTLAQMPGNALDQRLRMCSPFTGVEIHLRSVFLQGLLLLGEAEAKRRVPAAAAALARWHGWCRDNDLPPLTAALGIAKGFAGVSHCVIGVDNAAQMGAIAAAWSSAPILRAEVLHCADGAIVDPRLWAVAA